MPNIRIVTKRSDYELLSDSQRKQLHTALRASVSAGLGRYGVTLDDVDSMWFLYEEGQNTIALQVEVITEPVFNQTIIPAAAFVILADKMLSWIRRDPLLSQVFKDQAVWIRLHGEGSVWLDSINN